MKSNILIFFIFLYFFIFNNAKEIQSQVVSGMKLWLIADSVNTSGNSVIEWYDLSGNNLHATQADINKCALKTENNPMINNHSSVTFDGLDDFFTGPQISGVDNSSLSIFIVASGSNQASGLEAGIFTINNWTNGLWFNRRLFNQSLSCYNNNSYFWTNDGTLPNSGFEFKILELIKYLDNNSNLLINGASQNVSTNSSLTGLFTNSDYTLGYALSFQYFKGAIAEIIVYNSALSDTERLQVEQYLRDKYTPPVDLGSNIVIEDNFCDTTIADAYEPWFTDYTWSTGESDSVISVDKPGKYFVTVTDIFGFQSTDSIIVSYPQINSIPDTFFCYNDSIIWDTELSSAFLFNWSNGKSDSLITIHEEGDYWVTVTDPYGCFLISDTLTTNIDSFAFLASLADSVSACSGVEIFLEDFPDTYPDSLCSTLSYLWSDMSTDSTLIVLSSGDYYLEVTNINGCKSFDTVHITIIGNTPVAEFSVENACLGSPQNFIDESTSFPEPIVSWWWDFGDSTFSDEQNPTHTFAGSGTYQVKLTVTNSSGCQNIAVKNATVYDLPNASIDILYGDSGCVNTEMQFYANPEFGDSIEHYYWDFNNASFSDLQNPVTVFENANEYNVVLQITDTNDCSNLINSEVTIYESVDELPSFFTIAPQNGEIVFLDSVSFEWNSVEGAIYYLLEVSSDLDFSSILSSIETTNVSIKLKTPLVDTFYWRVIAYNRCLYPKTSLTNQNIYFSPSKLDHLSLWFIGDSTISAGPNVTQWNDLSGNNYHSTQSDPSKQPIVTYNSSINNYPTLSFDGINDFLTGPLISDLENSSISIFTIASGNSQSGLEAGLFTINDWTNGLWLSRRLLNQSLSYYNNNSYFWTEDSSLLNSGFNFKIFELIKELNVNTRLIINCNNIISSTNVILNGPFTNNVFNIGYAPSFQYLNGSIAEIIVCDTSVTEIQKNLIEQYLRHKYSPPVNLQYDIHVPYGYNDTAITTAYKPWFTDYIWNTEETDSIIHVNESGTYTVTVTDIFGFTSTDDIRVVYDEPFSPGDVTICLGDTLTWNPQVSDGYVYEWTGGLTDSVLTVWEEGTYQLLITDTLGFFRTAEIYVSVDSFIIHASLGPDVDLCIGNLITIEGDEATGFLWPDGSTDEYYMVDTSGVYWVTATNENGCVKTDSVHVNITGIAPITGFTQNITCFGQETNFTDTSYTTDGSNIISYDWDFGDAAGSGLQNPEHTFADTGFYTVLLEITTDSGCSNFQEKELYVHPLPVSDFGPDQACKGNAILFENNSAVPVDEILTYLWNFGDDSVSSLENPEHTYHTIGSFTVELIAVTDFGCTDTLQQTILIKPVPVTDFSFSEACVGTLIDFYDETTHTILNPILSSTWIIDGDSDYNTLNASFSTNDPGAITVTHIVQTINGCRDTVSKSVVVHDVPDASFETGIACQTDLTLLDDNSTFTDGEITKWNWSVNGIGAYSDANPVFVTPDTGTFEITLVISDENHCRDTAYGTLTVYEKPYSSFGFNPWFGTPGSEIVFTNTSLRNDYNSWDFGDGQTSFDLNPVISYADSGIFDITLITSNDEGCYDTLSRKITVIMPVYDVSVLSVNHEIIDNKLYVSAIVANLGTIPVYGLDLKIDFNMGSSITETWSGEFMMGSVIYYNFSAIYEFSDYTLPDYICVEANLDPGINDVNPLNNIKCNNEGTSYALLEPYPNPAHNQITLEFILPYSAVTILDIYDSNGKQVDRGIIEQPLIGLNRFIYDTSKLAKGVYHINMNYEGSLKAVRFVKN